MIPAVTRNFFPDGGAKPSGRARDGLCHRMYANIMNLSPDPQAFCGPADRYRSPGCETSRLPQSVVLYTLRKAMPIRLHRCSYSSRPAGIPVQQVLEMVRNPDRDSPVGSRIPVTRRLRLLQRAPLSSSPSSGFREPAVPGWFLSPGRYPFLLWHFSTFVIASRSSCAASPQASLQGGMGRAQAGTGVKAAGCSDFRAILRYNDSTIPDVHSSAEECTG